MFALQFPRCGLWRRRQQPLQDVFHVVIALAPRRCNPRRKASGGPAVHAKFMLDLPSRQSLRNESDSGHPSAEMNMRSLQHRTHCHGEFAAAIVAVVKPIGSRAMRRPPADRGDAVSGAAAMRADRTVGPAQSLEPATNTNGGVVELALCEPLNRFPRALSPDRVHGLLTHRLPWSLPPVARPRSHPKVVPAPQPRLIGGCGRSARGPRAPSCSARWISSISGSSGSLLRAAPAFSRSM